MRFLKQRWLAIRNTDKEQRNSRSNPSQLLLNEAFNESLRCIFIAIPKTGTTSIRTQLKQEGDFLIPNPHLNIVQIRDCIYPYLLRRNVGMNNGFPTSGIQSDHQLRNTALSCFDEYFKFSFVRNPWSRAVSLYFRKEGHSMSQFMDFQSFCSQHFYASDTCLHPTLHQNQLDWLTDLSGKLLMNYVGKLEAFDQAIQIINESTQGRIRLQFKHENRNPRSLATSYRDFYDDRSREIIAKRFEKDIDTFKYSF
jgi:chondroitin 4-sulfotransferase 11